MDVHAKDAKGKADKVDDQYGRSAAAGVYANSRIMDNARNHGFPDNFALAAPAVLASKVWNDGLAIGLAVPELPPTPGQDRRQIKFYLIWRGDANDPRHVKCFACLRIR